MADNEVRKAQELNKLESEEKELFGFNLSNYIMSREIQDAESPFLSTKSIQHLVGMYLNQRLVSGNYILGEGPMKTLRLSIAARSEILADLRNQAGQHSCLRRKWEIYLKGKSPNHQITFDPETAEKNRDAFFVTPVHPLVKQAASYFAKNKLVYIHLEYPSDEIPTGDYPISIYAWDYVDLQSNFKLVIISEDPRITEELPDYILTATAADYSSEVKPEAWDALEAKHIQIWQDERVKHIESTRQVARYKLESLNNNFQNQKSALEVEIRDAVDKRIEKMHRSELEKVTQRYQQKAADIEANIAKADIHTTLIAKGSSQLSKGVCTMSIADTILQNQDRDGMLRRSLERIIQLYTDKSHFIYELLQNAEDAGATGIRFVQYSDRLEVMHDGKAFTTENLQGLCDIGQSDKVNNLNQIGEFGVGFKSVFGICDTVRLYSSPRKQELANNCHPFAVEIKDFIRPIDIPTVVVPVGYTTLFVFPYSVGFQFSGFKNMAALNNAITKRLKNLGVTTLLFMRHLELIEYEIKIPGVRVSGKYMLDAEQINDHCTRVSAIENDKTDKSLSFIKFSMPVDSKASNRTIDIAFAIKTDKNGNTIFQKAENPYISVYFPTETESKLNFIVQGPFRTTPNRSSVPFDEEENKNLALQTAKLLRKSIIELRDM